MAARIVPSCAKIDVRFFIRSKVNLSQILEAADPMYWPLSRSAQICACVQQRSSDKTPYIWPSVSREVLRFTYIT